MSTLKHEYWTKDRLPANWQLVQLGDVCEHSLGKMLDREKNQGELRPYLRNPNVQWFEFDLSDVQQMPIKDSERGKYALAPGDVVICEGGEAGRAAIWSDQEQEMYIQKALHRVRVKPCLYNRFLVHVLMADAKSGRLNSYFTGTTIPHFTGQDLHRYIIPLPPLTEQKRIADILDKADAIRRKRQEAWAISNSFLSAEFRGRFGDPSNSPYDVVTLDDICLKVTDGAHRTPTYVDSGVPFLRVTDVQDSSINWNRVKYIPQSEHDDLAKRCCPEMGDVLYSKNGTIGIPKFVDWQRPFSIFVSLALLKPNPELLQGRFLESFLKTPFALKQATSHSKTLTVTNLHLVEIRKIRIPLPPLSVQEEWVDFRDNFEERNGRLATAASQSNDLFNALVQRAFKGEL